MLLRNLQPAANSRASGCAAHQLVTQRNCCLLAGAFERDTHLRSLVVREQCQVYRVRNCTEREFGRRAQVDERRILLEQLG